MDGGGAQGVSLGALGLLGRRAHFLGSVATEPAAAELMPLTPFYKAFGERIAARHPDSQTAEIQIHVAIMNRFSALGTAEIVRVG